MQVDPMEGVKAINCERQKWLRHAAGLVRGMYQGSQEARIYTDAIAKSLEAMADEETLVNPRLGDSSM
jgi:hypothetical protein